MTGAGAGPRGQCRLATCPGVPQGALPVSDMPWGSDPPWLRGRIRGRVAALLIPGSNHFAFPSLAALHLVRCTAQYASSARRHLARQRPLAKNTASTPPHRPIEFFANNFFDCRHRGSLAASTQVNNAPRVRHPPSIFSTYAPRLERVLLTRGDGVLHHIKISGSHSNLFCW
jgi:hypothetical protein